jgi:hypothetical protein
MIRKGVGVCLVMNGEGSKRRVLHQICLSGVTLSTARRNRRDHQVPHVSLALSQQTFPGRKNRPSLRQCRGADKPNPGCHYLPVFNQPFLPIKAVPITCADSESGFKSLAAFRRPIAVQVAPAGLSGPRRGSPRVPTP